MTHLPPTTKTPGEKERFTFSFADSLATAEVIDSGTVVANPAEGLTITTVTNDNTRVQCFIAGGKDKEVYVIKAQATTDLGQILDNDLILTIERAE